MGRHGSARRPEIPSLVQAGPSEDRGGRQAQARPASAIGSLWPTNGPTSATSYCTRTELRKHLGTKKTVNTKMLTDKIRSYQWLYWHRGEDLWLATGKTLEEAFLKEHCQ
eukprot:51655-Pyramimonas_sp.AAC.1